MVIVYSVVKFQGFQFPLHLKRENSQGIFFAKNAFTFQCIDWRFQKEVLSNRPKGKSQTSSLPMW